MESDLMIKALDALDNTIDTSGLRDNEKNALKQLVEKLRTYYIKKYNAISKHYNEKIRIEKLSMLRIELTDYLVIINDTINGKNDVFGVTNYIYKKTNYDDKKGVFKRKRLI